MRAIGVYVLSGLLAASLVLPLSAQEPAASQPGQVAATGPAQAAGGPAPKLRIDEKSFDFGEIWDGDKVEHDFVIHNDGDAVLEIPSVRAGCGCTATEWDRKIEPGEKGRVHAVFDTKGKGQTPQTTIYIQTNDPNNARFDLRMHGKAKRLIDVDPAMGARFGRVVEGKVHPIKIKVTNNLPDPLKLELLPLGPEAKPFDVSVKEVEPGKAYEITVTPRQPLPEGSISTSIQFKTGAGQMPTLAIPVNIFVPAPIEVFPPSIILGAPPARELPRPIDITFNEQGQMKILSAGSSDPSIKTNVMEITPGKKYRVLCQIPAGFNVGHDQTANITIATDLPAKKEIVVPITMRATPQPTQAGVTTPGQGATLPAVAVPDNPVFDIANYSISVGSRKAGEVYTQDIYFRNSGGKPLEIAKVAGTPALKINSNHATTIAPGAAGMLQVEVTTPDRPGPFIERINLEMNDPQRPTATITLSGQVRPYVEVQPTNVDFGRRPQTHAVPRAVKLSYNGQGAIKYLKAESSNPSFEVVLQQIGETNIAKLQVIAKGPFQPGENAGVVRVTTDCQQQPTAEVAVLLVQPGRIEVDPPKIVFFQNVRHMQRKSVAIYNNGDKPMNILAVRRSQDKIKTQFYPDQDNLSYQLHLTLPDDFTPAAGGERIVIQTDDPEYKEIVIPLSFMPLGQAQQAVGP
ncbi:MAG TPA: DUF1573 domain-containing protein [Phycisphaerae bacterium]|nr:DUF1573 domain-containing protein [Phycisphaerae bacterium]